MAEKTPKPERRAAVKRSPDDTERVAMRARLQHLQSELERLNQAIDEHFAKLNAGPRDGSKE